jgi:heptosyltransferase-2
LFPDASIALLARPHARDVLANTGLIDEIIETDLGWSEASVQHNPFAYNWRELARVRRKLRRRDFDVAFSSRLHVREHVVLALSGARRRIAFALDGGDGVLTDAIPFGNPNRHKVDDWHELLRPFGGPVDAAEEPRLKVSESERDRAKTFLARHGVSRQSQLVAIHPGASVPSKRWPLGRFIEVASRCARIPNAKVLTFIAPDGYGAHLALVPEVISAKVGLRELIALLERCHVLVCNDSGPMHLAGALGVPAVAVFGSGIDQWFSPLGEGHRLLTVEAAPSKSETAEVSVTPFDIAGVTIEQVLVAVNEVLDSVKRSGTGNSG